MTEQDGRYFCEYDGNTYDTMTRRYILAAKVGGCYRLPATLTAVPRWWPVVTVAAPRWDGTSLPAFGFTSLLK